MARGPGKGVSNNPKGKPKGTQNKLTKEARELLKDIMDGEVNNIKDSLEKIRNDDHFKYLSILEKWMSYVLPKKKDITSDDKPIQSLPITGVKIIEDGAKKPPPAKTG